MGAIHLKTERKQLIEQERDLNILKAIKTLLQKTNLDPILREKLTSRALQSEEDILSSKVFSKDEVIQQTNRITGKGNWFIRARHLKA